MTFKPLHVIDVVLILTVSQGTVSYYLLLDNRFRVANGYLGAEFQETVVCFLVNK